MNRLIALLLLAPGLANAGFCGDPESQSPECDLIITGGTMVLTLDGGNFTAFGKNVIGPAGELVIQDFSTTGTTAIHAIGPNNPCTPMCVVGFLDNIAGSLNMSFTTNGVPWQAAGSPKNTFVSFDTPNVPSKGAGQWSAPFTFIGGFEGGRPETLPPGNCTTLAPCMRNLQGDGTAVFDVVPLPGFPGAFFIDHATYTFSAPEPSTASLLLLGLAGFAVMSRRGRSRTTLLAVG